MSDQRKSDIPRAASGYAGFGQGPAGAAQGAFGSAIAAAMGPQIGMQRAQLGGMESGGQQNPMRGLVAQLASTTTPNFNLDTILQRLQGRLENGGPLQTGQVGTQGRGGVRPW